MVNGRRRAPRARAEARPGERGATLVEFAFIMPLLFVLLFGVIDIGRLVAAYSGLVSAAREAARYGSAVGISPNGVRYYVDCDGIRDAGLKVSKMVGLTGSDITVEYDAYTPPPVDDFLVFATCPAGGPGPNPDAVTSSHRVRVTVDGEIELLTPIIGQFFSGGSVSLSVSEARSLFEDAN